MYVTHFVPSPSPLPPDVNSRNWMPCSRSRQVPAQERTFKLKSDFAFYVGKAANEKTSPRGQFSSFCRSVFFFWFFFSLPWTASIDFHKQMEFALKMLKFPFLVPEYLTCKLNEDRSLYLTHFILTKSRFFFPQLILFSLQVCSVTLSERLPWNALIPVGQWILLYSYWRFWTFYGEHLKKLMNIITCKSIRNV